MSTPEERIAELEGNVRTLTRIVKLLAERAQDPESADYFMRPRFSELADQAEKMEQSLYSNGEEDEEEEEGSG